MESNRKSSRVYYEVYVLRVGTLRGEDLSCPEQRNKIDA